MFREVRSGPKRFRQTRRDLPFGQVRRWDKSPGHYTPNIERARGLAPAVPNIYPHRNRRDYT